MNNLRSFFLIIGAIASGCHATTESSESRPTPRYATALATCDTLPTRYRFISTLEGNYTVRIQPRVDAFLKSKHFENGMPVTQGQLLYTLEEETLRNTTLEAEARVASARAQLVEAERNYRRAVPLAEIEAISQSQLDGYRAQWRASEAALRSAEQELSTARINQGYAHLYAPIAGIVAASEAHVGDYVGPSTPYSVLTSITNLDTMSVVLELPMQSYSALRSSDSMSYSNRDFVRDIDLYTADGNRYPWHGKYDYTRRDISSDEGTLGLVVLFPNPAQELKAGGFAQVEATLGRNQAVVMLPAVAISEQQGIRSVWVVRADSTLEYRQVEVGAISGDRQAILSGVSAGERILTEGIQKVRQGEKIAYK